MSSVCESSSITTLPKSQNKKTVTFSTLEIREYPIVLGNNPSTLRGPSVELGWQPQSNKIIDLESYEESRASNRRTEKQMIMTVSRRVDLLLSHGYTFRQINENTKQLGTLTASSKVLKKTPTPFRRARGLVTKFLRAHRV